MAARRPDEPAGGIRNGPMFGGKGRGTHRRCLTTSGPLSEPGFWNRWILCAPRPYSVLLWCFACAFGVADFMSIGWIGVIGVTCAAACASAGVEGGKYSKY